jgi:serine protease inhibitor
MRLAHLTRHLEFPEGRRRRSAAGKLQLHVEVLEARCLLTVAPVGVPIPASGVDLASYLANMSAPLESSPIGLQFPSSLPPVANSPPPPSSVHPTAALSPAQVSAEKSAGQSIDAFGLELYKDLQAGTGGSGNLFLSPLSISTALAMVYAGARGETAAQMASVLHLSGDAAGIAHEFGTLLADLNSAGQGDYALSIADALWGQQGMEFLSQFLDTMQTDYGGGLNQVDFMHDADAARQTINDWVAGHTNDKIQDLFSSDAITADTRLVLANAIYFQGAWANAFRASSTFDADFTLASGASEQVPTMHNTGSYRYMQKDGFQVVELPYAGGRLAMDVLLPSDASGSAGLGVGQLPSDLNNWFSGLGTRQVQLSLPKFKLTTEFDLADQLTSLGMGDAFNREADFSGITDPKQLQISQVRHKATIDVTETGTEAAAATGVGMQPTGMAWDPNPPVQFNADQPFLFMIRDTLSGSVLFMGQEANPLSDSGDSSVPGIDSHSSATQPVQSSPVAVAQPSAPTSGGNQGDDVVAASPGGALQASQGGGAADPLASAITFSQSVSASGPAQQVEVRPATIVAAPEQSVATLPASQAQLMSAASSAQAAHTSHDAVLDSTENWSPLADASFDELGKA